VLAISVATVLTGCGGDGQGEVDTALAKAVEAIGAATDSAAGRLAGREYTNAELAAFMNTYNDAEIEMGQLAQTKASDPEVRTFAQALVREHRALKTEVTNTAKTLNVTPAIESDIENVTERHQENLQALREKASGRPFDEAFLEHEIRMHRSVLDEIEDTLGRNTNAELRPLLEKARDGIRAHLTKAEELEKKVAGS
jgi:putative membrane protein